MKEWLSISCLLCVFGFVREIRPSEPYITEYLVGEWHNFTKEQVYQEVYPIGTYSYLAQLVVVFLITDLFRYKPLIITIGATGVIIWSMLIWTSSLAALQTVEFFYGTYMAAEVAYYTYIYAKVDKKYYPRVTSHTRAAMFGGKLVAGISSQLLVYFELMNYKELNYITLATQLIAMLWAFSLPKVEKSLYFHRDKAYLTERKSSVKSNKSTTSTCHSENEVTQAHTSAYKLLWQHFRNAYTNIEVLQWSIWYIIGFCGYLQIITYVQVLWIDIKPVQSVAWNGAVDAVLTALAAICSLVAGYLHAGRLKPQASLLALAALSILEGGAVLLCCWTRDIVFSYVGFILFGALYAFTITVASAEVARYLQEDSFGLVFGFNTLMALLLQSILTLIVVSGAGFSLSIVGQYTVYAFYFIIVGVIYALFVLIQYIRSRKQQNIHDVVE